MQISLANRSTASTLDRSGCFPRSSRQLEWDRDQAGWEARLRKLTGRVEFEEKPSPRIALTRTTLRSAGRIRRLDALLLPRSLPALVGTEQGDLACAGCSAIIGQGITVRTARREHPEGNRLVVRCTCGALNLLCTNRSADGQ